MVVVRIYLLQLVQPMNNAKDEILPDESGDFFDATRHRI